jgi:cytochrome c peroxidase
MKYKFKILFYFLVIALLYACSKDIKIENPTSEWDQTPYIIQYPSFLNKESNQVKSPADNPLTRAGVELGRKLFYEPMLSVNNSISCASCHNSAFAFSDTVKFSKGAFNQPTTRNSMPLFNIAFQESKAIDTIHRFFWDGSSPSLERQSIVPILNPIEMASDLKVVIAKLQASAVYPKLFKKAFGTDSIYTSLIQKALAQFERTLVSFESKYDEFLATKNFNVFTEEEKRGYALFYSESKPLENIKGADCFHCHGAEKSFYMTDFQFKNNGLQKELTDSGLFRITNKTNDLGKFKTPSLRNLAFTAPYMHNGSKQTLKDVIDFYNTGGFPSPWVDPNIGKHQVTGGLQLTEEQKQDLIAFLLTMTDNNFVKKIEFTKPN